MLRLPRCCFLRGGAIQPWETSKTPPDYYAALGIKLQASEEEIRKAHKRLALQYHPDKNSGSAASSEQFVKIQVISIGNETEAIVRCRRPQAHATFIRWFSCAHTCK